MNIHTINFGLHTPPPTYKRPHLKAYLPVDKKVHPPPPPHEYKPTSSLYWNEFDFFATFWRLKKQLNSKSILISTAM